MEIGKKKCNNMCFIFLGGCIFYISYIIYIYWNTPFFDTMFDFLWLPEKYHEGILSIGDFRFRYVEHGMMGYSLFYLVNSLFFGLSMRFDIILNIILVMLSGAVACIAYYKTIKKRSFLFYIGLVLIVLVMFSPTQGFHSGMSIQIRLGMTLAFIALFYSEKINQNETPSKKSYVLLYILIVFSYLIFGTFYTFSWIAAIMVVYSLRMIYERVKKIHSRNKEYCIEMGIMVMCVVLYFLFYKPSIGKQLSGNSENPFEFIFSLAKFIIISMGSVTLPWDAIGDGLISENLLRLNSLYVTIFTLIAVILFFKTKMWTKTFLPLIMILYTLAIFCQIYLGRSSSGGIYWAYNSWYNVHTKFLLVAVIWVYFYAILEARPIRFKLFTFNLKSIRAVLMCLIIIIAISFFSGFTLFTKRVSHIKVWIENKVHYLTGDAVLTADVNGNTELLVPYEKAIHGIEILKKYRLSIFRIGKINFFPQTNIKYNGFYEEDSNGRWITGNASIIIENNPNATHFLLAGYYPENWPENKITISINNNESKTINLVPDKSFNIDLEFENIFDNIYITIKTDNYYIPKIEGWNADSRELGAYINSWSLF